MLRVLRKSISDKRPAALASTALGRFKRDERGAIAIYGLTFSVLMITLGGIAVDLMRYEARRTALQQTLDRSTLAAASLTQELDPTAVVQDYFDKAQLSQYLTAVDVQEGLNFRNVTADALADAEPFFLHMIGIDGFEAPGHSQAEQRITNVEIMLVLDVSGSMGNNNRLTNLKTAAVEFVDTVLSSDDENRISVGLVPFNGQVNLGEDIAPYYNLTNDHGVTNVNCVDLSPSTYSSSDITTTQALSMTAHADTYSSTSQSNGYVSATSTSSATPAAANRWCPPSSVNVVRPPDLAIGELQGYINGLQAIGATSINAGMKWGVEFLDPGSRPMFAAMAGNDLIPDDFANRPFDYVDDEAMKVIVLMTDGEHFAEERVGESYKTGTSPIWKANDGYYSIFHVSKVNNSTSTTICNSRPFYVPHLSAWHSRPWNGSTPSSSACYVPATTSYSNTLQQSWPQVWSSLRVQYVAWQMYARALGSGSSGRATEYSNAMAQLRSQTATSVMDTSLQTICTLAKDNDITVYGIAFEAPTNGQTQIRNCASSTAHYFNASGLQIRTAFRAIANNISQLRLTQ